MKLSAQKMDLARKDLPLWKEESGVLKRTFAFRDFTEAIEFVKEVAYVAEARDHHPDINIRWNRVTLMLTTHEEGGVGSKDFSLAREIEASSLVAER